MVGGRKKLGTVNSSWDKEKKKGGGDGQLQTKDIIVMIYVCIPSITLDIIHGIIYIESCLEDFRSLL